MSETGRWVRQARQHDCVKPKLPKGIQTGDRYICECGKNWAVTYIHRGLFTTFNWQAVAPEIATTDRRGKR